MKGDTQTPGRLGEEAAARFLEGRGWRILARNVRRRFGEIDIVARDGAILVFVEVKTHRRHSPFAGRLWAVDRRKKRNLLRASANWLMRRRWRGNYRFDVIEVYGERGGVAAPEIDHIENVRLFPPNWRFW